MLFSPVGMGKLAERRAEQGSLASSVSRKVVCCFDLERVIPWLGENLQSS